MNITEIKTAQITALVNTLVESSGHPASRFDIPGTITMLDNLLSVEGTKAFISILAKIQKCNRAEQIIQSIAPTFQDQDYDY